MSVGPPYDLPWLPPSRGLRVILGIARAIAVIVTWRESRAYPERALATGLFLASVAYPLTWVATRTDALNAPYCVRAGRSGSALHRAVLQRARRCRST
jgi:hypothetical protein